MWAYGNIGVMISSPTPEQIAKMDADQLRVLLLSQIKVNSTLQAKVLEVESTNADLQVVVKYKDAVISKITLELALPKRFRFCKKAESLIAEQRHIAQAALEQFNAIYAVEAQLQDIPPDELRHRRQTEIKPLMDKLRLWLLDHKIKVPDGSGTMKAIDYILKRWDALTTFLDDPHTPIDNNWVEN